MIRFTIPGQLPGYNQLTEGHWATRQRLKESVMQDVAHIARFVYKIKQFDGKAQIDIRCYEPNNRRDEDNVVSGAAKVILDTLQNCGIIKGDGRKYVKYIPHPVEVDRENPRVEVEIREVESDGQ